MFSAPFQGGICDRAFYPAAFRRTSLVEIFRGEYRNYDARPVCDCISEETAEMSAGVGKNVEANQHNDDCDGGDSQRMLMDEAVLVRMAMLFVFIGLVSAG